MSYIEKFIDKILPEVVVHLFRPLLIVLFMTPIALIVTGPAGAIFGQGLAVVLQTIFAKAGWVALALTLLVASFLCMTGMHLALIPVAMTSIAEVGYDEFVLVVFLCFTLSQGAAALAVGIKSKDKKIKSLALPSSLSAFMGITEPAIFGVNLRFFKPFIAGCIGGGCGALYASLVHLGAKGTGVTGIFGIQLCLNQPLQYLIEMVIAVGVAFAISFVIYKDAEPKAVTADVTETTGTTETVENIEIADNNKAEETLTSPVNGTQISLSEVADETFASEMLGTTVAVEPGKIVAPCDGEVSNIFETGHAVCITTESGGELLIHIGIDTVKMDGKGFTKKVSDGDKVHAGDILVEANLEQIKNAGYQTTTMMILTNTDEFGNVTKAEPAEVKTTSKVMTLTK